MSQGDGGEGGRTRVRGRKGVRTQAYHANRTGSIYWIAILDFILVDINDNRLRWCGVFCKG